MNTLMQLAAGAMASAFAFALTGSANGQSAPAGIKNIVLVHGAFADGSSWAKVVPILQSRGYNVIAVQNPLTSLEDDVAATRRAIAVMDGQVLLVGHSWAGMVITEAGVDPKVAGLVYISALVPNEGQTVEDVTKAFPSAPGEGEFRIDGSGFLWMSSKGIHEYFAQDLPTAERATLFATQGYWAATSTKQKVTNIAWKTKPSWSIVATEDKTINPQLQRAEAAMISATTIELEANHVPMLSEPKKVAHVIMKAASSLTPKPALAQTK